MGGHASASLLDVGVALSTKVDGRRHQPCSGRLSPPEWTSGGLSSI